jgi:hypothetical protein
VRAFGVGKEDGDDEGAGSGCWSLVTGPWLLVSGRWSLVAGIVNLESDLLIHYFFYRG